MTNPNFETEKPEKQLDLAIPRVADEGQLGGLGESASNSLVSTNAEIHSQVLTALEAKREQASEISLPISDSYSLNMVIAGLYDTIYKQGFDSDRITISPPTSKNSQTEEVDLAINVVGLAKSEGRNPVEVANEMSQILGSSTSIAKVENIGPFVNIGLDYSKLASTVFQEVEDLGDRYGHFRDGEPLTVIVDYSSPNVAKNMTVAHLRSTIIGQSLIRLQEASGNVAFGVNHIGDWGTQFGSIIYEYKKELAERGAEFEKELANDPTATLLKIYRQFNERKDSDPESVEQARRIFLELENGDPQLVELWDQFRKWSLRDFGPTYERLGIKFDAIQGESFYEDRMQPVINDALDRGVLRLNEDGAVVFPSQTLIDPQTRTPNEKIMLDQKGEPRDEIILKPSGGTVYLTRDLAAIQYRGVELGADRILYVIGKEQQAHCLELFNMAHQLGYMALGDAVHISFGHLNIDGRKMKSREGKIILLNDLLNEVTAAALEGIQKRKVNATVDAPTKEDIALAEQIGVGSIIFNDLRNDRQKDIEFDPNTARALEVGGSIYVQYTNSRISSILDKADQRMENIEVPDALHREEKNVLMQIARFPVVLKEAVDSNSPHKVANFLTDFCKLINEMYHNLPILKAETEQQREFRLKLIKSAQQVIRNSADIVQIQLPERI